MVPGPLPCSTPSSPLLFFVTLSPAPFFPLHHYPAPVNGVSRLTYFNIWLVGPSGHRTNRPTWQVSGSQAICTCVSDASWRSDFKKRIWMNEANVCVCRTWKRIYLPDIRDMSALEVSPFHGISLYKSTYISLFSYILANNDYSAWRGRRVYRLRCRVWKRVCGNSTRANVVQHVKRWRSTEGHTNSL